MSAQRPYPIILSIAGSDSGGGAGIQADIKTGTQLGVFVATAISSVTAQNTLDVTGRIDIPAAFIRKQIETVCTDTLPHAVKTGMLPTPEAVREVAGAIRSLGLKNVVVDPVLISTSGHPLASPLDQVTQAMREELFPLATIITPNLHEATYISGTERIEDLELLRLCELMHASCVLLKGGHLTGENCDDLLIDCEGNISSFPSRRIQTVNTHGTGCSLSSAIACSLAAGLPLKEAVEKAKHLITDDIRLASGYTHGKGHGPLYFFTGDRHYLSRPLTLSDKK